MPSSKPVLIFDGDCGFCRRWITRWKELTRDQVLYLSSQESGAMFPDIPPQDFQKAVQLVEPDGRRSSAAEAVFRTLRYSGSPQWLAAYQKVPGFAVLSEFLYDIVAGHRPAFSWLSRFLFGDVGTPSSYRQARWLFLRVLALIYGVAFWTFAIQLKGLIGAEGILPARQFLEQFTHSGVAKFWYVPTLAWLKSSDGFLLGLCGMGAAASVLVFLNILPRVSLLASWLLYLSLVSVGGDFMNFQWDALLLETGFLAIFLAPAGFFPQKSGAINPSRAVRLLLGWLLFRLMVQSALVKWMSGDLLWHHLTALTVHFQTQPIPNPLAWVVHQAPGWFQKMSCVWVFLVEGYVPFLIVMGRRPRQLAFWLLASFQVLIMATGNYAFFNGLTLALCILLLDDAALRCWLPSWCDEPMQTPVSPRASLRAGRFTGIAAILFLTTVPFLRMLGVPLPGWMVASEVIVSPLRSFNSYGLFAVMTPKRPEIILEGSDDGKNWKAYSFKYKAGDLHRRPPQVAPYQPRLDWQMWFAALSDYRQNPWFMNLCIRLLQGSTPVLDLLAANPFPQKPPTYMRAMVYDYRFTTWMERKQTGQWWARDVEGLYCPVLSLRKS